MLKVNGDNTNGAELYCVLPSLGKNSDSLHNASEYMMKVVMKKLYCTVDSLIAIIFAFSGYIQQAFFVGLAAGTILYVVVFEVLQRERSKSVSGLVQLLFVVAGFSAMMCVDLFGKILNFILSSKSPRFSTLQPDTNTTRTR